MRSQITFRFILYQIFVQSGGRDLKNRRREEGNGWRMGGLENGRVWGWKGLRMLGLHPEIWPPFSKLPVPARLKAPPLRRTNSSQESWNSQKKQQAQGRGQTWWVKRIFKKNIFAVVIYQIGNDLKFNNLFQSWVNFYFGGSGINGASFQYIINLFSHP